MVAALPESLPAIVTRAKAQELLLIGKNRFSLLEAAGLPFIDTSPRQYFVADLLAALTTKKAAPQPEKRGRGRPRNIAYPK